MKPFGNTKNLRDSFPALEIISAVRSATAFWSPLENLSVFSTWRQGGAWTKKIPTCRESFRFALVSKSHTFSLVPSPTSWRIPWSTMEKWWMAELENWAKLGFKSNYPTLWILRTWDFPQSSACLEGCEAGGCHQLALLQRLNFHLV